MGCKLPKPRGSDEAPGKIYSTLRKAQVETHSGVAYTYHFLDFLLGKEEVAVSSLLCLSSVRELPVQMSELYQQGFTLAAVHPFVHTCGPDGAKLQRQLHRAVLIRETHRCSENGLLKCVRPRLETDVCFSGVRVPDLEVIQNYVKKVQDQADLGVLFVGFLQQPDGAQRLPEHCDTDNLSSIHSSQSPIHQHTRNLTLNPTSSHQKQGRHVKRNKSSQKDPLGLGVNLQMQNLHKSFPVELQSKLISHSYLKDLKSDRQVKRTEDTTHQDESTFSSLKAHLASSINVSRTEQRIDFKRHEIQPGSSLSLNREAGHGIITRHCNGNYSCASRWNDALSRVYLYLRPTSSGIGSGLLCDHDCGVQVFALYNHAVVLSGSPRFYSLRIPLQVHKEAGLITTVNAHWLDHMTQHFRRGAQLVDGYFHLESSTNVETVFIFQSASDEIMTTTTYDAIVVEQWTVIDGVAVKTDYIPLLQSLAPYGWRLMCVLPTPIVKTNSDGSLATKQILFLQRPVLSRKRRDFMLHLKGHNKRNLQSKEKVGEEILSAFSAGPAMERSMKERENWMKYQDEVKNGPRMRDSPERSHHIRTPPSSSQKVKTEITNVSTVQEAKNQVKCGTYEAQREKKREMNGDKRLTSTIAFNHETKICVADVAQHYLRV